jgi:flagellar hook-associated protein 2
MDNSISFSLGIGSGLDINQLVKGLTQAERAPKEALIKQREVANAAKVSALAEASGAIDSFASALSGLISGGSLFAQPSVSEPNLLGASAVPGVPLTALSAELEVLQLAKAQTLQSAPLASASEPVGQGSLTLTTSRGAFTVVIDQSNDSLTGLAAAINDANSGVSASIVTGASGARLVLKGGTGAAEAFTLGVPDGTATGLERFAFGPAVAGGMTLAQASQDAVVKLDGVEVRRASNSFRDVIAGVQIDLKRAQPGTTVSLGLTRPSAAIEQTMADFVSAYNQLADLLAKATAPAVDGKNGGPLRGDLSIREMKRQLAQIPSTVLNSRGTIRTLAEIGVGTNRDGTLTLNAAQLKAALERDPAGVEAMFNPTQYSSDPLLVINTPPGKVRPGTYVFTDLVPASGGGNASGLMDGVAAIGSGDFLIAPMSSRGLGLSVEVRGALASATVTIDPGLGGALQSIRDTLRARTGPIIGSQDRLRAEAAQIAKERQVMETRSAAYSERLLASFTAMERQVSAFKATQSYLEQQVKIWSGDNN